MWEECWPTVERFLTGAEFWHRGPNGHLLYVDYAALAAGWSSQGEHVDAAVWRELKAMFAAMKAVVNTHINEKLEDAARG